MNSTFDIRNFQDRLTPANGKNRWHCPVCDGNDFTINPDTAAYQCWSGECTAEQIRNAVAPLPKKKPRLQQRREWVYCNAEGVEIIKTCRIDNGNGKKIWQQYYHGGQWQNKAPDGEAGKRLKQSVMPYQWHRLKDEPKIFWVEGEVVADALLSLGIPATTSIGGSKSLNNYGDYTPLLAGKKVVVCPDMDAPGVAYMEQVREMAETTQWCYAYPSDYRWGNLPKDGGLDLADWIEDGATRSQVLDAVQDEPIKPKPQTKIAAKARSTGAKVVESVTVEADSKQALNPFFSVKLNRRGEVITPKPSVICNALLAQYKDSLIFSIETKRFYRYEADEKGVWSPEAQEILRAEISEELDKAGIEYSSQYINSVVSLIGDKVALKRWEEPTHLIPVENGVLNRQTLELLPHSPKYKWRWKLPYPFSPVASCQPILDWLHEACEGQQDRVEVLLAYLKAILTRRTDLQRFVECVGEGGTGKGTYLRLATALAGVQNTMPTSLKQLEGNRFETAAIFGKILVTITDSEKYSGDVSTLKALTGQDLLRFEAKNRQVGDDRSPGFYSDAMVLIASNEPMQSIDRTSGLQRRRLTIPFNNQVASSKRRDLITLTNQGASGEFAPYLSGLLYHVLCITDDRVTELIRDTESHCESLKEASQENILKTNPLADWLESNCVFVASAKTYIGRAQKVRRTEGTNEDGAISSTSWDCYQNHDKWLYANYRQFCDQHGIQKPISMKSFGKDLVSLCVAQLKETSVMADKDRAGAFIVGIALRGSEGSEHDALPTPVTRTVMVKVVDVMDSVMDTDESVVAETQTGDGCDGCDGFSEKSFNRKRGVAE